MGLLNRTAALGAVQGAGLAVIILTVTMIVAPFSGASTAGVAVQNLTDDIWNCLKAALDAQKTFDAARPSVPLHLQPLIPDVHKSLIPYGRAFASFAILSLVAHVVGVALATATLAGSANKGALRYALVSILAFGFLTAAAATLFGFLATHSLNNIFKSLLEAQIVSGIVPSTVVGPAVVAGIAATASSLVAVIASGLAVFAKPNDDESK